MVWRKKNQITNLFNLVQKGCPLFAKVAESFAMILLMHLIINKKGSSLSIRNGRYCVRTTERETLVPAQEVKAIHLHPATRLTYEVVPTALLHNTDILFIDRQGTPIGRIWGSKFGSISTIRKNQLSFSASIDSVEWIRDILVGKGENQLLVLELIQIITNRGPVAGRESIERYLKKLSNYPITNPSESFASFRGIEGSMSRVYFEGLRMLLPETYKFEKRSKRPAMDMFNCLLNYAYGMLYGICESALIHAGVDPAIGVMHRDEYNRPVLVYDFIEQYRHWADFTVCHLCIQEVVFEAFFDIQNGQFWLNTHGKRILIQSFNDYLNEVVTLEGISRSRINHCELDAQRFAAMMKKFT
jgi:CRISPR-associated protein Cas1